MHDLNDALDELSHVIPYAHSPSVRKLSKIATLLLAKNYILMQTNALNELRRVLVCLQQQSGASLPQALSASIASLLSGPTGAGTGIALGEQQQQQQVARLAEWPSGGATSSADRGCPGGACDLQAPSTTSSTVAAATTGGPNNVSVQHRRRKYNMLINRILGDVAAQQHQLLVGPLQQAAAAAAAMAASSSRAACSSAAVCQATLATSSPSASMQGARTASCALGAAPRPIDFRLHAGMVGRAPKRARLTPPPPPQSDSDAIAARRKWQRAPGTGAAAAADLLESGAAACGLAFEARRPLGGSEDERDGREAEEEEEARLDEVEVEVEEDNNDNDDNGNDYHNEAEEAAGRRRRRRRRGARALLCGRASQSPQTSDAGSRLSECSSPVSVGSPARQCQSLALFGRGPLEQRQQF